MGDEIGKFFDPNEADSNEETIIILKKIAAARLQRGSLNEHWAWRSAAEEALWTVAQNREITEQERLTRGARGSNGLKHPFQRLTLSEQMESRRLLMGIYRFIAGDMTVDALNDPAIKSAFSPEDYPKLKERFLKLHLAGELPRIMEESDQAAHPHPA